MQHHFTKTFADLTFHDPTVAKANIKIFCCVLY